ncbi:hypothetical protein IZY60_04415 [Lutibacter sp. B2]|nr:hypothetical protein [Lutibacter sp. B2]MBF8982779.1 hypothetical protein [Lutibacter sp. B2]
MKISQKTNSVLAITFSIMAIISAIVSFFDYNNSDIMILPLGFAQLTSGLNQINMAQQIDSKGSSKGNRALGQFFIILGIVVIVYVVSRMIV